MTRSRILADFGGVTSSATELNLLDGQTDLASQAELDAAAYDDTGVRQDISILALREAISENRLSTDTNLPNSLIETFEDNTGMTLTNVTRDDSGEYIATSASTVEAGFTDDSDTLVLLHFDGDDDATSGTGFTDSASINANSPHTINRVNTAGTQPDLATATKKLGSASMFFGTGTGASNSHGNSLWIADNADWDFIRLSANWTLETWIYNTTAIPASGNNQYELFGQSKTDSTDVGGSWHFKINSEDKLYFNVYQRGSAGDDFSITGDTNVRVGDWDHVACVRDGSVVRLYLNGEEDATAVTIPSGGHTVDQDLGGKINISKRAYNSNYGFVYGYLDELRISKTCRYPDGTTFTPNTSDSVQATGTVISAANTVTGTKTKVSGVMLYKDTGSGASTFGNGNDLEILFSCNGSDYTTVASYTAVTPLFSSGIKMVKLGETTMGSGEGGSDVRWKAVWATQEITTKKTQLHGIGLNY